MAAKVRDLKIKIFADGADLSSIQKLNNIPYIKGFTTNPTLMRKAGVVEYKKFAIDVLKIVKDKPISFEVFVDDINEMEIQAMEIASWGKNINVKGAKEINAESRICYVSPGWMDMYAAFGDPGYANCPEVVWPVPGFELYSQSLRLLRSYFEGSSGNDENDGDPRP